MENVTAPPALLTLPTELLTLILDLLKKIDSKSLSSLRLVCCALHARIDPFYFRSLALHDQIHKENTQRIICRLLDPEDDLSGVVRHLIIGPFEDKSNCPDGGVLIEILKSISYLRDLSWNSSHPIPPEFLGLFHRMWPNARLHVKNLARKALPMDTALLSSPQLYALEYWLYDGFLPYHSTGKVASYGDFEFPLLKQCLIKAANLKKLWVKSSGNALSWGRTTHSHAALQFPFAHGDRFPALESLRLSYSEYDLSIEHCLLWRQCQDFSKLRRLDLDYGAPRNLLRTLTGQVQQLESLSIGFWSLPRSDPVGRFWFFNPFDIDITKNFIASIEGLQSLTLSRCTDEILHELWLGIWEQHAHSLQTFRLDSPEGSLAYRDSGLALDVCPGAQHIEEFAIGFALDDSEF